MATRPAPSIESLLAYETAIEDAWQSIQKNAGIDARVEFSDAPIVTPRSDINLFNVVPNDGNGNEHYKTFPDGRMLYDVFSGILVSKIVTTRGENSSQHNAMLGRVRLCAFNFRKLFTAANLPFHTVRNMKEEQKISVTDSDRDLDLSELHHRIVFSIDENAWPALLP